MLTMTNPLDVHGIRCYQDEGNRLDANPKQVIGFWVIAEAPRLAVDDKGAPDIRLVKYRGADKSGANFNFTLTLMPPDETLTKIAAALRDRAGQDAPLTPIKFTDGRLTLFLPSDSGPNQNLLVTDLPMTSGVCAIAAQLSTEGALLVEQSARGGTPLMVGLDLGFDARLTGAEITCTCNGTAAVSALRALASSASPPIAVGRAPEPDAAGRILDLMTERGAVKVTPSQTSFAAFDPYAMAGLNRLGREEVTRRLLAFLTATPLPADNLPPFASALAKALTFKIPDGATVRQRVYPEGPLAPGLDPTSWIVEVDLDNDPNFQNPATK
jgi:hypothetical protein